ncbi:MAG: hypothetical protein F4135_04965 [Acidimicrobiia bacterium]|nr:hypothetical protein [Acidimicrobiia bacterium]
MRFAAKIAARFDLYETADTVAHLADDTEDRYLLLIAASLSGNPAVDSSLRARIRQTVGADPAVLIRLDHHYPPTTSEEKLLYQQCWPGGPTDPAPFPLPPVVVLDQGFDARSLWRLASRLNQAGAVIKRLAPNSDLPPWFGPRTVLICEPKTGVRVKSKYPTFPQKQIISKPRLPEHGRLLSSLLLEVNAQLPDRNKLRLDKLQPEIHASLWNPDVFGAGVYKTAETAFLAGSKRSSLEYLRRQNLLVPLKSKAVRWAFRDLVAVRTWAYLKQEAAPKRVSAKVVQALAGFAGDSQAVKLGVTSGGQVLVDHGKGWIDIQSGQTTLENLSITDIDEVFRPFSYGAGKTLPLPNAGPNTTLRPEVLHGTPYLKGHRISAKSLAKLDIRNGREAILSTYPELNGVYFEDAVSIGHQLLRAS